MNRVNYSDIIRVDQKRNFITNIIITVCRSIRNRRCIVRSHLHDPHFQRYADCFASEISISKSVISLA